MAPPSNVAAWSPTKLEDVCQYITVGHVGPMAHEYTSSGVPFLRSQDVRPFRVCLTNRRGRISRCTLLPRREQHTRCQRYQIGQ